MSDRIPPITREISYEEDSDEEIPPITREISYEEDSDEEIPPITREISYEEDSDEEMPTNINDQALNSREIHDYDEPDDSNPESSSDSDGDLPKKVTKRTRIIRDDSFDVSRLEYASNDEYTSDSDSSDTYNITRKTVKKYFSVSKKISRHYIKCRRDKLYVHKEMLMSISPAYKIFCEGIEEGKYRADEEFSCDFDMYDVIFALETATAWKLSLPGDRENYGSEPCLDVHEIFAYFACDLYDSKKFFKYVLGDNIITRYKSACLYLGELQDKLKQTSLIFTPCKNMMDYLCLWINKHIEVIINTTYKGRSLGDRLFSVNNSNLSSGDSVLEWIFSANRHNGSLINLFDNYVHWSSTSNTDVKTSYLKKLIKCINPFTIKKDHVFRKAFIKSHRRLLVDHYDDAVKHFVILKKENGLIFKSEKHTIAVGKTSPYHQNLLTLYAKDIQKK